MRIDHVALFVRDLAREKAFYQVYFGASAHEGRHHAKSGLRSYVLSFSDGMRLELMNRPDMGDTLRHPFAEGYIHVSFSVGSREQVEKLTERLRKDGRTILKAPHMAEDGAYESCILDPEGNQIEITD